VVFEDALSGAQAALAAGTVCVGVQQANRAAGLLALGVRCVVPDLCAVTLQEGALQIGGQYQAAIVQNAGVDVK
jgi:beta-phosphoglucomutase-like phosphatase (HAD superfamily)